jgi:hypothetical protein
VLYYQGMATRNKAIALPSTAAEDSLADLERLEAECWAALAAAKAEKGSKGNTVAIIGVVEELRKIYETRLKARQQMTAVGEMMPRAEVERLETVILEALAPYPAAMRAVAAALEGGGRGTRERRLPIAVTNGAGR